MKNYFEALVYDKKRKKFIKFIWSNKAKYEKSREALIRAQTQGRIEIIGLGQETEQNYKHYLKQVTKEKN